MMEWEPIETAPKVGVVWLFEPHEMGGFMFAGSLDLRGSWRNNLDMEVQRPTHWMKLPDPPA